MALPCYLLPQAAEGSAACPTNTHTKTSCFLQQRVRLGHLSPALSCSALGIPWQLQPTSSLQWTPHPSLIFKLLLPESAPSLLDLKPKFSYVKAKFCLRVAQAPSQLFP